MELPDETIISYYDIENDSVKVYIETPDEKFGFKHATCFLPAEDWIDILGYTDKEIRYLQELVQSEKHMILEFAQNGGLEDASISSEQITSPY